MLAPLSKKYVKNKEKVFFHELRLFNEIFSCSLHYKFHGSRKKTGGDSDRSREEKSPLCLSLSPSLPLSLATESARKLSDIDALCRNLRSLLHHDAGHAERRLVRVWCASAVRLGCVSGVYEATVRVVEGTQTEKDVVPG